MVLTGEIERHISKILKRHNCITGSNHCHNYKGINSLFERICLMFAEAKVRPNLYNFLSVVVVFFFS